MKLGSPIPAPSFKNPESRKYELSSKSHEELIELVVGYEDKIQELHLEVHSQDLLDRNKIVDIFGFNFENCPYSVQK